jgi:hypothetical protein
MSEGINRRSRKIADLNLHSSVENENEKEGTTEQRKRIHNTNMRREEN